MDGFKNRTRNSGELFNPDKNLFGHRNSREILTEDGKCDR